MAYCFQSGAAYEIELNGSPVHTRTALPLPALSQYSHGAGAESWARTGPFHCPRPSAPHRRQQPPATKTASLTTLLCTPTAFSASPLEPRRAYSEQQARQHEVSGGSLQSTAWRSCKPAIEALPALPALPAPILTCPLSPFPALRPPARPTLVSQPRLAQPRWISPRRRTNHSTYHFPFSLSLLTIGLIHSSARSINRYRLHPSLHHLLSFLLGPQYHTSSSGPLSVSTRHVRPTLPPTTLSHLGLPLLANLCLHCAKQISDSTPSSTTASTF